MLDDNLTQQLKTYLATLREPVELVASLGEDKLGGANGEAVQAMGTQ